MDNRRATGYVFPVYIAAISLMISLTTSLSANNERAALIAAIEAANHWSWYQAKTTRARLVQAIERDRYDRERQAIAAAARHFERKRNIAMQRDTLYDMALLLFNMALMTATAAILLSCPSRTRTS